MIQEPSSLSVDRKVPQFNFHEGDWSWKRFLIAVGFGLILPSLFFAFSGRGHTGDASRASRANALNATILGDGTKYHGNPPLSADSMLEEMQFQKIKIMEEDRLHRAEIGALGDAGAGASTPAPKPTPTLGLLSLITLGYGLTCFSFRHRNIGWKVVAAIGILGALPLGYKAMEAGAFEAFASFLSLRPGELLNLPVGQASLILLSAGAVALSLWHLPELVNSIVEILLEVGRSIRESIVRVFQGIGIAVQAYAYACWWLAGKAVHGHPLVS